MLLFLQKKTLSLHLFICCKPPTPYLVSFPPFTAITAFQALSPPSFLPLLPRTVVRFLPLLPPVGLPSLLSPTFSFIGRNLAIVLMATVHGFYTSPLNTFPQLHTAYVGVQGSQIHPSPSPRLLKVYSVGMRIQHSVMRGLQEWGALPLLPPPERR